VEQEQHDQVLIAIRDYQGRLIRLTQRQWDHILLDHQDMADMQWAMRETLENPAEVRKSVRDPNTVRLYYRWFTGLKVGEKWVCVVVKFLDVDALIITAYVTDKTQTGELVWATE
jgi:hypothetical protein